MLRVSRIFRRHDWTKITQFSGDCYLQSMMGHGLRANTNAELVDKLVARGFLVAGEKAVERIKTVDRAKFLSPDIQSTNAVYSNNPHKISAANHFMSTPQLHAQIISLMLSKLGPGRTAMEIGCGSGFLPAVFRALGCDTVIGVETDVSLLSMAKERLTETGIIFTDKGPNDILFDAVYVAPYFASFQLFEDFINSLKFTEDAVCVAAVQLDEARMDQQLILMERSQDGWKRTDLFTVLCEPLVSSS